MRVHKALSTKRLGKPEKRVPQLPVQSPPIQPPHQKNNSQLKNQKEVSQLLHWKRKFKVCKSRSRLLKLVFEKPDFDFFVSQAHRRRDCLLNLEN